MIAEQFEDYWDYESISHDLLYEITDIPDHVDTLSGSMGLTGADFLELAVFQDKSARWVATRDWGQEMYFVGDAFSNEKDAVDWISPTPCR